MSRARNGWVLPVSLLLALLLGLVPLPGMLQPLRPYWLALVLAYWLLEEHEQVGLGVAFTLGVVADLVFGGLLGEQAMRLVVMAFILDRFRARMRFFPLSQQAMVIGVLDHLQAEVPGGQAAQRQQHQQKPDQRAATEQVGLDRMVLELAPAADHRPGLSRACAGAGRPARNAGAPTTPSPAMAPANTATAVAARPSPRG